MAFEFNPVNGLRDKSVYPDTPISEEAAREYFQGLLDQLKAFLNDNNLDGFSKLLATNGFQKYPSGLIEQWGTLSCPNQATTAFAFPIAFPNKLVSVSTENMNPTSGGTAKNYWVNGESLTAISVYNNTGNTMNLKITVKGY